MIRFLLAACVALRLASPAAAQDHVAGAVPRLPVAAFAERPFFTNPVLSPDGKRIAAHTLRDGEKRVVIIDIDNRSTRTVGIGDLELAGQRWAGNQRLLVTVAAATPFLGALLPTTQLFVIDVAAGTAKPLDPSSQGLFAGDIIHVAPAGDWLLIGSQSSLFSTPSVKRIDLATGAVSVVERERPGVWNWYADDAGVVRAGIAYAGERWTIWYREKAGDPLQRIRGRAGASKEEEGAVDGFRFLTDAQGGTGIIVTNARTGRFAAYRYDFEAATIGAPVYENAEVDIAGVVVDAASGKLTGVSYQDDRYHVAWIDPVMLAVQARVDRLFPGRENVLIGTSGDRNRVLLWSGSASDPGTYYVLDRATKRMMPIASPLEELTAAALATVTPVRYPARDGLTIPAYLTLPRGRTDKALPLIVLPHGGPFVRDTWDYDPYVQFLANRGYAVLQPNFRGSTGYGKAFVEKGHGQWGRAMQDDLDDGVDWLVKAGTVDPKRVCIMGASYGGYAALWGAIRNPERYRCAISLSGVTDLPAMLRYDRRIFSAPRYFREWQEKVRGTEKIDLDTVSPLAQADRLSVPVLIAHGEKDAKVPAKQSHAMVDALKRANRPVESVFYPDEGHGLAKREDVIDFLGRLDAFLARVNPSDPPPAPSATRH